MSAPTRGLCRLPEHECHRRCAYRPGACDLFGEGLESDGRPTRLAGRRVVQTRAGVHVELDLRAEGDRS